MFELNELSKECLENAEKREKNGGRISTETRKMLKHTATELIEATEAYHSFREIKEYKESGDNFEKMEVSLNKFFDEEKKNFSGEIADIVCCCMIIAAKENIDMEQAVLDCMEKNKKRADGTGDKL